MLLTKPVRRPSYDPAKTDHLNNLRVDYLHAREAAKSAKNAKERAEWNQLAEDISKQIHDEGFRIYGPPPVEQIVEQPPLTSPVSPATIEA